MKALSVKSPHAQRIALGHKTMELRSKPTRYRGPLLICVSARPIAENSGRAICLVDVAECRRMLPGDEADACHRFVRGHFVWKLSNVRLIQPFPVRGRLCFFEVDDSLIRVVDARLSGPTVEAPPSLTNVRAARRLP